MLIATAACGSAWGQTPTPTPNGEFLCSAGPRDGQACNADGDCAPTGVCVIAQGVCNGGLDDGFPCDCTGGTCMQSTPSCDPTFTGVCQGGPNATLCCDVTYNCTGGNACVGSQKVCVGGNSKGYPCLNDGQCPGSLCQSTGKFCNGGDFASYSCVDDADCNLAGSTGGTCVSTAQPTPTPAARPCTGDCDGSGDVTVNELITMVNIALGTEPLSACPNGDADGSGTITVNEIITAVGFALNGCPAS
ncbi:MAG: hypothetical protein ACHQ4J_15610 [Candidatus Binatia bacterium]